MKKEFFSLQIEIKVGVRVNFHLSLGSISQLTDGRLLPRFHVFFDEHDPMSSLCATAVKVSY